jgi:hypothetical protein
MWDALLLGTRLYFVCGRRRIGAAENLTADG